jgi:hypothetical protein
MRNVGTRIRIVVIQRMLELESVRGLSSEHVSRTGHKVSSGPNSSVKADCIQWIIQSSRTKAQKNVERLTQQVIALFFASSHQMPMVCALSLSF